uniref:Uncharacterized protein n=1 Tax=Tanacetum cinerariifolium TaxID=118510 RepID=A0A699V852_TANCI|nr:hypothetical protein [Tanacetum cinerariifolium]
MLVLEYPFQSNDSAALEDEVAKGFTNIFPSTIAFGLSSSTFCKVITIFVAREDEFVGFGVVSAIVVDAVDVWQT